MNVRRTSPAGGQPTIEQVAARAGVGRGTVSRVINGSPQVTDHTREAVLRAIDELGYVPNRAARALVTQRTDTVALLISESEERIFGEPFFAGIVRGVSTAITASSRQLVLAMAQSADGHSRLEHYLTGQHVDGVLLLSLHGDDPLPDHLLARGLPVVLGGRPAGWTGGRYVDVDNRAGARAATEHLIDRGRRRIATITGPRDMSAGLERLEGYRQALAGAGQDLAPAAVAEGDFSEASGVRAMRDLLARVPDLDAVFAASDPMAVGALTVLREHGRQVPGDVAVVGFDDSPVSQHTDPPLTSVHQPAERMGQEMAALLLAQMEGRAGPDDSVVLPTELVVRQSS
ncbi:MAG TPA: LacI family DNA-binding transcriptional regulator [Nocardioidaceae bacterium]|nr:LacI family DNA-binding transcriptional regulator [Nocardioidaceae bacterium]